MSTMPSLLNVLPPPATVLNLEPEELAGFVMEYLHSLEMSDQTMQLQRENFAGSLFHHAYLVNPEYKALEPRAREKITEAAIEAWSWLEREGFLAPKPGPNQNVFITRRGHRVKNATDLDAFRKADLLPRKLLHPLIAEKTWALFMRGEYDTAVFQAFKEVEVAVREAGKFKPTDLGTDLMRKAFDPKTGPLRDENRPEAERLSLAHLFAGAIGSYKNPSSHRRVTLEAEETVEVLILASHLLRIVDARKPTPE